jgi:hypothetical protein
VTFVCLESDYSAETSLTLLKQQISLQVAFVSSGVCPRVRLPAVLFIAVCVCAQVADATSQLRSSGRFTRLVNPDTLSFTLLDPMAYSQQSTVLLVGIVDLFGIVGCALLLLSFCGARLAHSHK